MFKSLKSFLDKAVPNQRTIIKFVIVGFWNTFVGYLVYYLTLKVIQFKFETTPLAYVWAMGVAQIIGTMNAYVSHRQITFSERARGKKLNEFLKFSLVYVLTFVLSLILMPVFVRVLGVSAEITGIIVILIGTVVSYLGHSKFSFKPN